MTDRTTQISRRTGIGLLLGALAGAPSVANATTWRIPEFLVYFSPNSADLSSGALSVIRDAKTYFDGMREGPPPSNTWCRVIGGVDGLELSQGRQGLAMERAASVGRALTDLGMTSDQRFLSILKGPMPFAPSKAGAAEAFNRAVLIGLYAGMAPIGN